MIRYTYGSLKGLMLLLFLLVFSQTDIYATAYDIHFKLNPPTDSLYYLAHYYGDRVFMSDTALVDQAGNIRFTGDEALPGGVYILVSAEKARLLEFIVDQEQHFQITLPANDGHEDIKVEGSRENTLFFAHIRLSNQIGELAEKRKQQEQASIDEGLIQKQLGVVRQDMRTLRDSIISLYPDRLLGKMLLAMQEVSVPDSLQSQSDKAYRYYKDNYWKNTDLADDRLLRTPLLPGKLRTYFEQLIPPQADSIIRAVDHILARTTDGSLLQSFLVWHFTTEYQNPKIMGLEKVFVHLADEYFARREIANTSTSLRNQIMERADQLRNLLIGVPAPNLILIDTAHQFLSFKDIEARFTVLFFWDYDCGICKKDLKVLQELYHSQKYELEVYAIGTNSDLDGWKKYIQENELGWINVNGTRSVTQNFHELYDIYGTPVIYVLDQDKHIIAKQINASQLDMFFENYLNFN